MKIFVSHVNAHQRTSTDEEALNNQVDHMICFVNASQLSLVLTQLTHVESYHGSRDGRYILAQ